jgi:hypothetical protein
MRIVLGVILMAFGCSDPAGDSSMSSGDNQADKIKNLDIHRTYTEKPLSGTQAKGTITVTYASPKRVDFTTDMLVLAAGQVDHFHLTIENDRTGSSLGGSILSMAVFTRNAGGDWQYQGSGCGGCQDMTFSEVWLEKDRARFYGIDPDYSDLYLDINGGPPAGDVGFLPTPWESQALWVDTNLKGTYEYKITASCNDGPCGAPK